MPDFSGSKTQPAAGKTFMHGFAPRKHPAPGLQPGLHRKTSFCFSASICRQGSHARHFAASSKLLPALACQRLSGLILYRAPRFPVVITFLQAPAGQHLSPHIFSCSLSSVIIQKKRLSSPLQASGFSPQICDHFLLPKHVILFFYIFFFGVFN